jgi:F-type H+-transporting ATPase subunit b
MFLASAISSMSAGASALGVRAAPKGGVTVDVDLTFLWSAIAFVILLVVLKPVLLDPMLKLFEERERRIEGTKAEALKLDDAATAALVRYEDEMKLARAAGTVEREARRAEGRKVENEIIGKVREATSETIAAGRKELQAEAVEARAVLRGEAKSLAGALASRVLGREVQG